MEGGANVSRPWNVALPKIKLNADLTWPLGKRAPRYLAAMLYEFMGYKPVVHPSAFIHPQAVVTGNVTIGRDVYIGPGAALRGDWGEIIVSDGCNVQENCTIHMFPGTTVLLEESAHIGHGAIIHGARVGRNCLVGMNAVLMDNVVLGEECIVGALSFLPADSVWERRQVIVGNPARAVKAVSDEMIAWKTEGTRLYQELPAQLHATLKVCDALREPEAGREPITAQYRTWKETRSEEGK
jgi:phenylacetic acid degradation protein